MKHPPANAGDARDADSIPESGRSSRAGNGNPLQCSRLQSSMDRRDWQAEVHGDTNSPDKIEHAVNYVRECFAYVLL